MKKKILNHIKVIIIILIGVTILFSILGAFNISARENMQDFVPKCYPNVVTDNESAGFASYNQSIDNKYILKTQILPPKGGTVCPTEISEPASKYLDSITTLSPTSESVEISQTNNSSNSDSYSVSVDQVTKTPETTLPPTTQVPYDLSEYNTKLDEIKGAISIMNQKKEPSDTCPPCPACERCPEPAFDCKKVPNYRSPSIGQYLPMPVLTDFSKF